MLIWDVRSVLVISSLLGDLSVSIKIKQIGQMWWFTGVYGLNNASHRYLFWDELADLSAVCGNNWCLARDFNVIRNVRKVQ